MVYLYHNKFSYFNLFQMLKVIAFKNFVHFKNKTVISLDVSKRGQAGNSNVDGKPTTGINFLNIFVGANFSGKSTVLELIRRCMTEKKNVSETSSCDEGLVAYAFCKFDLAPYDQIISGIIKHPNTGVVYKILAFTKKLDTKVKTKVEIKVENKVYTCKSPNFTYFHSCKSSVFADISAILSKEDDDVSENKLLQDIENECENKNNKELYKDIEPIWDSIENKYVATFPLRGIGSIQWSNSNKISKREENYSAAYERAEIISELLSEEQNQFINADEERKIFKYLTDSEDFEFEKKGNTIEVKHNGKPFPLLKISEGIFEAKSTSLLLAHTHYQTLCLEDPDRGMHPQMIERLRSVLYESSLTKTIIVVTHSPYFIDSMTIDKTHVFFRRIEEPSLCSVLNIGKTDELSKVADIDIKRPLLFATTVLLVEGVTDREVVHGILKENKCKQLKEIEEGKKSPEDFTDLSIYQIIPVGGCSNAAKIQQFCKYINLPCLCLLDLDAAVKLNIEKIQKFEDFKKDWREMFKQTLASFEQDSQNFFEKLQSDLKVFVWKHGGLEDAILSSADNNKEIAKALGIPVNGLKSGRLKDKLKKRIDDGKEFYTALIQVPEIDRFISFIETETRKLKSS